MTPRNPWRGCDRPWREFVWDMTHFGGFLGDAYDGLRGRNPTIGLEARIFGSLLVAMAMVQAVVGVLLILH